MRLLRLPGIVAAYSFVSLAALLAGCSSSPTEPGPDSDPESGYFESASNAPSRAESGGYGGTANAAPNGPGASLDGSTGDAAREIAEADIIQLQGSTLYAMSRTGGLSIIDVGTPTDLKILGRYRTSFTPFEMYVKDGVVFAMYTDWGQFVLKDGTDDEYEWKQTSQLLALDATDPTSITKIGEFALPGEISDSRLVGDVLYTVSYQNGSCWDCSPTPNTHVASIDVSQPEAPVKVDELSFDDESPEYGWGKRSISVTSERIYIAGPEYGYSQPENSTIQVVDISDPAGSLVEGAQVKVKGQITNRWQMDEYEGTLRVISQPWQWWNGSIPPSLETFTVASSQSITPLAKLQMTLPEREQLMSVRFDGARGYAVTAIQTDPLFTFDLSDPAAPKQLGELVMPGFLYHMEPRGDRLLALGYDQGNAAGAITVSLFDVSDLGAPTMIERVNFGGNWGQLPEDQDRIHKVFKIDQENGLILVPYSGYSVEQAPADGGCGRSLNGVQLVDFVGDDLALRGSTSSLGQARRAFVASGTLFTVADQEVAAYDIADRDQPAPLSGAPLALNVSLTLPTGDKLVRLRQDWYSDDVRLEVVDQTSADAMVAPVTFNLSDYLRTEHGRDACHTWYPSSEPLLAVGDTVWILINDYGAPDDSGKEGQVRTLMVGFSIATGKVTGSLALPFVAGYWGWGNTSRVVRGDVALLLQEGWDEQGQTRTLVAVDLSDASKPRQAYAVPLPADDYYASTGMLESGDEIVTSYAERVPGKDEVVRHFALRIGVADPLAPTLIGSYNVPGYVVDFDAATQNAVTLDHQPVLVPGSSHDDCAEKLPTGWYDESTRACRGYSSTLHRVSLAASRARVLDSARRDELAWSTPRRGDGRLFFTQGYYGYLVGDASIGPGGYYGGWSWATQNITIVDSATLAGSAIEVPGVWQVVPNGQSLVLAPSAGQPLSVIDGADAERPQLLTGNEMALGYTNHLSVRGNDVFLAQGDGGVQHMTLP